jgi:tetratricopeptide (TPR) repeat protein
MKSLLSIVLGISVASSAGAQSKPLAGAAKWADSVRVTVEAAQIAGDVDGVRAARALAERALTLFPNDPTLLHYQGYALYREASSMMGRGQGAAIAPLLAQAIAALEASAKRKPMAETSALLAVLYGNQIALDPSKGMTLGMLSQQLMSEAAGLGPQNPRVWLMRGQSALFTPEAYGGGVGPATEQLAKAIALFERDRPAPGAPAWGRAEAHLWLGQAYQRGGDTTHAAAEYRAALALEPGYAWVKSVLLPGVARRP